MWENCFLLLNIRDISYKNMNIHGLTDIIIFTSVFHSVFSYCQEYDQWSKWWTYDGFSSGPLRWGDNDDWGICKTGKNQSPINIDPNSLLFDPQLQPLVIEARTVDGKLRNTRHDLTFIVNASGPSVNFTSGPLSYTYRLYQIKLHYGRENYFGSEHRIDNKSFVGEIQFTAYNSDLYVNESEAQLNPRGIAILSVFISVGEKDNSAFKLLQEKFKNISEQDTCVDLSGLPIDKLLPRTDQYMTYGGSQTQPGCRETVTWIILNKPAYISRHQLSALREVPYQEWMFSNARPLMPLNHRTVRTNINFKKKTKLCTMEVVRKYEVNPSLGGR